MCLEVGGDTVFVRDCLRKKGQCLRQYFVPFGAEKPQESLADIAETFPTQTGKSTLIVRSF